MIIEAVVLNQLDIPWDDLLPEAIRAIVFQLEYVIKNVFLPGQIENWVTIVNVSKLGISQIDKSSLKSLISCLSDNYRCWNRWTFILNTTFGVKMIWMIIKPFLHASTKAKIMITDDNSTEELM